MASFHPIVLTVIVCALCQLSRVQPAGVPPLSVGATFEYVLAEDTNFTTTAEVIFVDYETLNLDLKNRIKAQPGEKMKRIICYVNVGAWEAWREDAEEFPKSLLGNDGWEEEKWLDIRQVSTLIPIMEARFKLAAANGCEGIEPDNVDGFENETGFEITSAQQLAYNLIISSAVKKLGLLVGLKNDPTQAAELVDHFDFAVTEACVSFNYCSSFDVFVKQSKPVFAVEYIDNYADAADFKAKACPIAQEGQFSVIMKEYESFNNYTIGC